MMYFLSTIVVVLVTGNLVFSETHQKTLYKAEDAESLFEDFIVKFERVYKDEQEKQFRFEVFKKKLEQINELNSRNEHAVFGITKFSDYTEQELEMMHGQCYKPSHGKSQCTKIQEDDGRIFPNLDDEEFDWREHNAVTEVKNQGHCHSCYAFSTIGNIEGQLAIHKKELVNLSPKQIVDCDKYDDGCSGGLMYRAMSDIKDIGGVMTEEDYPYTDEQGECRFDKNKVKVQLSGCREYITRDENKLAHILKKVGPLSVAVNANRLYDYHGGILEEPCEGKPNHAVLLVGYGSKHGMPYWILKNSWGADHNDRGYFRIKRGINSMCIVKEPTDITSAVIKI